MNEPLALYVHIPFCRHRCAYCDFNTYAGQEDAIPAYVETICREINMVAGSAKEQLPAGSIFLGGGTPSLLPVEHLERILSALDTHFRLFNPEITLEANPGTVSLSSLRDLRSMGFNRLSFGVQSFHPDELRFLERTHDPFDIFRAEEWARRAGFNNINFDLIFGIPGQTMARWQATLKQAINLHPQHLSLYALAVEPSTPLGHRMKHGLVEANDPDMAADMYEASSDLLAVSGFEQYEISNWSCSGKACRHNLQYWRNQPYLGFGAGAHGYADGIRYSNVRRIKKYVDRLASPNPILEFPLSSAAITKEATTPYREMQETMMLGLRLIREGIEKKKFHDRFDMHVTEVFGNDIMELTAKGLLEWEGDVLHLTRKGRLLGNQVFLHFV